MAATHDAYRSGSGTPLVLLHGIMMSWRIWRPVLPMLEERHEVYAPTLPGHRDGPEVAAPGGMPQLADGVEMQLDAAGLDTAHVVGNSLGGWLACELAQRGRARSVTAFSPAGSWRTQRDFTRLAMLIKSGRGLARNRLAVAMLARPRTRRMLLRTTVAHGERLPNADVPDMLADMAACSLLDELLTSVRTAGPLRTLSIGHNCPVQLVWPRRDRTLPFSRYGRPYADMLPDAKLVSLRGVGHMPMHDDPELVAHTITALTSKADAEGGV